MLRRIALVTHASGGGVWSVTRFLWERLRISGRYEPEIVLLATAARDPYSVCLRRPDTWLRGPRIQPVKCNGLDCWHVGALFAELEPQRYRPRSVLTGLLNNYDLVQVVAGSPAWAAAVMPVERPVCLFAATMVRQERATLVRDARGWRRAYWPAMNRLVARVESSALDRAACVFAESEYTRRLLEPYVQPGRLVLAVPGVDTDQFHPSAGAEQEPYILSVARFGDPRKNVRLLFEAYHSIRQCLAGAPRLVLAGATLPAESDWAYAVELGLARHIELRQVPSPMELAALYRNAAFFVLPSNEEGLGVVILEAMASGLPVVSTDCGGPATAVVPGETGLLTPVGDAEALAEAMRGLLADSSLRLRMGRAGRERAEQVFSLEAAGRTYLDKYAELLR